MIYEKAEIVDLGSITRHTFATGMGDSKGFANDNGDEACELSHSGDTNPNGAPGLCDA